MLRSILTSTPVLIAGIALIFFASAALFGIAHQNLPTHLQTVATLAILAATLAITMASALAYFANREKRRSKGEADAADGGSGGGGT